MRQFTKYLVLIMTLTVVTTAGTEVSADGHGSEEAAEDGHGAHEDAGHGGHTLNWFDLTNKKKPAVVALLFNFALLVIIVYFMLRKSLAKRFKDRKVTLETALKEAEELKAKAEKALTEARAKMNAIDSEMAKVRKDILEAGEAESTRIVEEADARAKRMQADAKMMVEQEIARISQEIREQVSEEIITRAEQLVREKIERADHDRLSRDYLNGLKESSQSADS
ncbi:MAG: ATP synthase F0 subunit B [Deltaproteobacteria bacterium]|nr:ATP synthase F0 subunit B [Deltaproteobacteria bacterium]